MARLMSLAVLLASTCAMWSLWSPAILVGGCDIPGARDYGTFADVLQCTRQPRPDCELVVVTTVLQSVDSLVQPSASPTSEVALTTCYYAIVDRPTAESLFPNRTTVATGDGHGHVDCHLETLRWNVVVAPDDQLPFQDPRRDSRVIKVLLHLFFPWAKYHLYLDGNLALLQHPADVVRLLLIGNGTVDAPDYLMAMPRHKDRGSVEEELAAVTDRKLDSPRVLQHQMDLYHLTEHPPMTPLFLGAIRVQAHRPLVRAFECLWWAQIAAHSRRDQLSLVKVIADLELLPRTTILPRTFFNKVPHAHEKGRVLDAPSEVSPYLPFGPVPALGRRVFLSFGRDNVVIANHSASGKSSATPLQAFLARAAVYDMQDGWEERTLHEQAEFEPRSWLSARDLVVLHLYVEPTDSRPAQLLKRYVADGTVTLVDLVQVDYATADPAKLRAPAMVDFRTTLRDVVENWGVPAMPYWNSRANTGWDERAWWLACRRQVALGRLSEEADKAWTYDSITMAQAWPASIWVIGFFVLPILFCMVRAFVRRAPPTARLGVARAVVGL